MEAILSVNGNTKLSERIALMKKDMEANEKVVISGSLCDWGDVFIPSFNLAIRIVTPMAMKP